MAEDFVKLFYDVDTAEVQEKYAGDETVIKLLNAVVDLTDPERVMKYISGCDDCVLCPTHAVSRVGVFADKRDAVWSFLVQQQIATVGKELMVADVTMRQLVMAVEGQEEVIRGLQGAIDFVKSSLAVFSADNGGITIPAVWHESISHVLTTVSESYSKSKVTIESLVVMGEIEANIVGKVEKEA